MRCSACRCRFCRVEQTVLRCCSACTVPLPRRCFPACCYTLCLWVGRVYWDATARACRHAAHCQRRMGLVAVLPAGVCASRSTACGLSAGRTRLPACSLRRSRDWLLLVLQPTAGLMVKLQQLHLAGVNEKRAGLPLFKPYYRFLGRTIALVALYVGHYQRRSRWLKQRCRDYAFFLHTKPVAILGMRCLPGCITYCPL